jgi:4-alpha-glucanotransferase
MNEKPDPRQTDAWGIDRYYEDALGQWHATPAETRRAIMQAMDVDPEAEAPTEQSPVLFLRQGHPTSLIGSGELVLESGETLHVRSCLPANLPFGYHELRPDDGGRVVRIIVSPDRCYLPEDLKTWGWAVQLYALRSAKSWGIGDLGDLSRLAAWSANELGAGMLMINPLHAATPIVPQQPSPYFPTSRRYRNPLYLAIEEVPGAREAPCDLERIAQSGRDLNRKRLIDRDAIFRLKMEALECIWTHATHDPSLDQYCSHEGLDLERFATFCALAEHHRSGWREWPEEYRHPESHAVRQFAHTHPDRVRFYSWVQWLIDQQLANSSYTLALMQDLPIGFDPDGADAWAWQDALARGVSVGAPPDKFNTAGQDWGLPPFVPHKLRAAAYEPFIQTIRATLRHSGGLRIDHVLGLFRLFWVPQGLGPAKGAYVRSNADELLAIVALESYRAQAFIVGEDLGTVEPGISEKLQRKGILSYRVFWFEEEPPSAYPELALASLSTHDLPTLAGMWTGSDLDAQKRLGLNPNIEETKTSRDRMTTMTSLKKNAPLPDVIVEIHKLLATAPSRIVAASLDDVLGVEERPNMPATTGEQWPNWSIALPKSLEQIEAYPLVRQVASVLLRER